MGVTETEKLWHIPSCSQAVVFQRSLTPQPRPTLTPKLFIKGKKKAFLVSSLWGSTEAWIQHDIIQSKWWFSFYSKPLAKGMDSLGLFSFFLERAVLHQSYTLGEKWTHFHLPAGSKVGEFCEVSPSKSPWNPLCLSLVDTYRSAGILWLRLYGKCCRLLSGGQAAVIPVAGGQGEEACWSTAAALDGTDLEIPTRAAPWTNLWEEVYIPAVQSDLVKSSLK